jgi:pimeloyl-ACP methyl ester carboxylesterase
MNPKFLTFIAIGLAFVAFAGFGIDFHYKKSSEMKKSVESNSYHFVKVPCWFDADWKVTIECGELHTPKITGGFILPVVILKADQPKQSDPIVYLQGGPGASALLDTDGIKHWLSWKRYSNTERDLILIDTRGTGRSKPVINCQDYNRFNYQLLTQHLLLKEELSLGYDKALECNPQNFGTQVSALDIRALMVQLDYSEWNILAVSYGTRLALEIARLEQEQPQAKKLKSMLLDSVYPAGYGGVQAWPKLLDDAMQTFFSGCTREPKCKEKLKELKKPLIESYINTLQYLVHKPIQLTIKRWDHEAPVDFLVNDHRFLSASFSATYQPSEWYKIIDAMRAVEEGPQEKLEALIEPYLNHSFSKDFNSLTFGLVDCADNPIGVEADYIAELEQYPFFKEYVKDQWTYQLCHSLVTRQQLKLVAPQVPTLILAGELDPITPIEWAKDLHHQWPQTQLRIVNNVAHSVLATNTCLLEHIDDFFNEPQKEFVVCR